MGYKLVGIMLKAWQRLRCKIYFMSCNYLMDSIGFAGKQRMKRPEIKDGEAYRIPYIYSSFHVFLKNSFHFSLAFWRRAFVIYGAVLKLLQKALLLYNQISIVFVRVIFLTSIKHWLILITLRKYELICQVFDHLVDFEVFV